MAVKLDMIRFPSPRSGSAGDCSKSRSLALRWQSRAVAFALIGCLTVLPFWPARADTNAGIGFMKQGYYIKAIRELQPEAEAGDVRAQGNLASIYYYGLGVAANFDKAFKWYHAAAIQGDPDGQIGLAILYIKGQGVTADLAIAHMWLTLALDSLPPGSDHERVSINRDHVAQQMNSAQLVESSSLVQHWYQTHQAP